MAQIPHQTVTGRVLRIRIRTRNKVHHVALALCWQTTTVRHLDNFLGSLIGNDAEALFHPCLNIRIRMQPFVLQHLGKLGACGYLDGDLRVL
jgi:hypothetical protein